MFKKYLFLIFFIWIYTETYAQKFILQQKGTIDYVNQPLKIVLDDLSLKYQINFAYSDKQINVRQKITIHAIDQFLEKIFNEIFSQAKVNYKFVGNQIILTPQAPRKKYTISGYIREEGSAELLLGVNIYVPSLKIGTTSNTYGFYSLTIPIIDSTDSITVAYSYVGYQLVAIRVPVGEDIEKDIQLFSTKLNEIVVQASRIEESTDIVQTNNNVDVSITQVKTIPALLGEKDVLKIIQLMPGVQKGSEGSSGIYVRGGGPDQNLLILDDAIVYNAMHLFGFFSVFNGDALKSVELIKGGFPSRYGGRLSSVIDMTMKDGNKEKFELEGGIGLISSRLILEAPILKNKSSFLISVRRTYGDLFSQSFFSDDEKSGYYFYDLNAKINYEFNSKNKIYLSGYFGRDNFSSINKAQDYKNITKLRWGNGTGTFRWNHQFTNKLFSNASLIFSNYRFLISSDEQKNDDRYYLEYNSGIRDIGLKYDVDFLPSFQHAIKFGLITTYHRFIPSALIVQGEINSNSFDLPKNEKLGALETGLYVEDIYKITPHLKINPGLRLSNFLLTNKSYFFLEPRFSTSYQFNKDWAIKASYANMNQYIHLLSNSGMGLPTDLWVPTTDKIAPQHSEQVTLGIVKDINRIKSTLSVEGYYKEMNHIITYKEGANFVQVFDFDQSSQVKSWENNIVQGKGVSYGIEFLLQKKIGRFSGWAGYTLSWTIVQFDEINFGKPYYARYDRRHDISLVGIYEINPRVKLSATWVYGTGNAITMPLASYVIDLPSNGEGKEYRNYGTEKNSFRMAPYHRLDVGIQFHKKLKYFERTWEISLYNVYNRANPFFYFIDNKDNKLKQFSLFPIIPSVSYNFKF